MAFDVFAASRRVRCPLLHVRAVGSGGGDGMDDVMGLWSEAVRLEFEAMAREQPNVQLASIVSSHMVRLDAPAELAQHLLAFLAPGAMSGAVREPTTLGSECWQSLIVRIADGDDCLADLGVLREQADLFGEVASLPTAWRVIDAITPERLGVPVPAGSA